MVTSEQPREASWRLNVMRGWIEGDSRAFETIGP
jgi:hypothetical protein